MQNMRINEDSSKTKNWCCRSSSMKLLRKRLSLRKSFHLLMWKTLNLSPKSAQIFKSLKLKLLKIMRLLLVNERHSCMKTIRLHLQFKNWKSNSLTSKPNTTRIEFYGRISLLFCNSRKTKPSLINTKQPRNLRLSLNSYKREGQRKRTSLRILMQPSFIRLSPNSSSNLRNKVNSFPKRKQTK